MSRVTHKALQFNCPGCGVALNHLLCATPGGKPVFDDVFLCGQCATVSIFQLTGLEKLTENQWKSFSSDERKDLDFAVRSCNANAVKLSKQNQPFLLN